MKEQVLKLLNDRKFCDELLKLENENEVKEHFKKNGVEITDEELLEIKEFISVMEKELKKLDNDVLKEISGGAGGVKKPRATRSSRNPITFTESPLTEDSTPTTTQSNTNGWDTANRIIDLISRFGSAFRPVIDSAIEFIGADKAAAAKVNQQGETERYRMKVDAIMGLAITSAIAGGIYVNRRRICKWIFGS